MPIPNTDESSSRADGDPVPSDRRFGLFGRLAMVLLVLAIGGVGVWALTRATTPRPGLTAQDVPALQVTAAQVQPWSQAPASLTAADPITQPTGTGTPGADAPGTLTDWARQVAVVTGIPQPAVWAYGNAELAIRATEPSCRLSWATIAGIGRVESNHGQFGGASLMSNGQESKPIIGVPLDGSGGVRNIPDTDRGTLDGDPVYDHAVGPLQFLPSTWREYASDAVGNGRPDPENINDAALAAARYLCLSGRDMGSPTGWWSGVLSYNDSVDYAQKVFGLADNYARQAVRALSATSH